MRHLFSCRSTVKQLLYSKKHLNQSPRTIGYFPTKFIFAGLQSTLSINMKNLLCALVLSVLFFGCQQKQETAAIYTPRILTADEKFNESPDGKDSTFKIIIKKDQNTSETREEYNVKFRDTLVRILINKTDPASVTDRFAFVQFINTQKTSLLVQIADNSGLAAPFYLIALKGGQLDVISLYRPSTGEQDTKYTNGLNPLGRTGYLVNNDFFITNVSAHVYLIKRQNTGERIQGEFILSSPDKSTLVFLTPTSLYQVHYPSDDVFNEKLPKPVPQSAALRLDWIRDNFSWGKNKKGITFLKYTDSERIVDIKEFQ